MDFTGQPRQAEYRMQKANDEEQYDPAAKVLLQGRRRADGRKQSILSRLVNMWHNRMD